MLTDRSMPDATAISQLADPDGAEHRPCGSRHLGRHVYRRGGLTC
jgi:hypothetical protein